MGEDADQRTDDVGPHGCAEPNETGPPPPHSPDLMTLLWEMAALVFLGGMEANCRVHHAMGGPVTWHSARSALLYGSSAECIAQRGIRPRQSLEALRAAARRRGLHVIVVGTSVSLVRSFPLDPGVWGKSRTTNASDSWPLLFKRDLLAWGTRKVVLHNLSGGGAKSSSMLCAVGQVERAMRAMDRTMGLLVILEFAMSDSGAGERAAAAMERLLLAVRMLAHRLAPETPLAVQFAYWFSPHRGSAEAPHDRVAAHHGVSSVSVRAALGLTPAAGCDGALVNLTCDRTNIWRGGLADTASITPEHLYDRELRHPSPVGAILLSRLLSALFRAEPPPGSAPAPAREPLVIGHTAYVLCTCFTAVRSKEKRRTRDLPAQQRTHLRNYVVASEGWREFEDVPKKPGFISKRKGARLRFALPLDARMRSSWLQVNMDYLTSYTSMGTAAVQVGLTKPRSLDGRIVQRVSVTETATIRTLRARESTINITVVNTGLGGKEAGHVTGRFQSLFPWRRGEAEQEPSSKFKVIAVSLCTPADVR